MMITDVEEVLAALKSYRCKHWASDVDSDEGASLVDLLSRDITTVTGEEELSLLAKHIVEELRYG